MGTLQSEEYCINNDIDFKEISIVRGLMGKDKNHIDDPSLFLFRKEDDKKFKLIRLNTYKFFLTKYKLFSFLYAVVLLAYLLTFPLYGFVFISIVEGFYYFVKPYKNKKYMKRTLLGIKTFFALSFLISGYYMFTHIDNAEGILLFSEFTLFGSILLYVRFFMGGLIAKYKEIYMIVDNYEDFDLDTNPFYIWKK